MQGIQKSFAYSDGAESERYLAELFRSAADLSSTSSELEAKIKDWPSEYHLSGKRANLLRGLNLSTRSKVLELGCGCGAITRYLGEKGFMVDAVEGSRKRAEIAALRCRGLDNINIVCANFNDLRIPENTYDAVFLVGVLEYAAKFWPEEIREEEAVIRLLQLVKLSLCDSGVAVVAIENRTGLKYVLGAHEDHYAKRYVGTHGYPLKAGIKTYTQHEWSELISASGFTQARYYFPFPDYKVPTLLLAEDYTLHNPNAYAHVDGIASRDYVLLLDLGQHETVFWECASATGTMGAFANSYLILLGNDATSLEQVAENDFAHLPDFKRKRRYCVITKKRANSNIVEREKIACFDDQPTTEIVQRLANEPFFAGKLLSIVWCRSLLIDPGAERFIDYLRQYYKYLKANEPSIDLVPNNIVVDDQGEYRCFDQEWQVADELDADYVYFRALLLFALRYKPTLREFWKRHSLYTVTDFIVYGFNAVHRDVISDLDEYSAREENFQNLVNEQDSAGTISELLLMRFNQSDIPMPVYAKVYWRCEDEAYSEERAVCRKFVPGDAAARITFEFSADENNVAYIRFDPCDQLSREDFGFLRVSYLCIEAKVEDQVQKIIQLETAKQVAESGILSGIVFSKQAFGEVFAVINNNPEIEFCLNDSFRNCQSYKVEVECAYIRSTEYRLVRDRFLVQEEILEKEIRRLRHSQAKLQREIKQMKTSKIVRLAERCKSIRKRIGT